MNTENLTKGNNFFKAIKKGDLKKIHDMIKENLHIIHYSNSYNFTGLHYATIYNHFEIVKLLVEKGADIHKLTFRNMSNLHLAAQNGNQEIFSYFIEKGCNPFLLNNDNYKPSELASYNQYIYNNFVKELSVGKYDIYYDPSIESKVKLPVLNNETGNSFVICPGLGILKKGTINKYLENETVVHLFSEANSILEFDIKKILLNGGIFELTKPMINQIGIYLINLSSIIYEFDKNPDKINNINYLSGFSLGEYTALVLGGVIDWRVVLVHLKEIFSEIDTLTKNVKYKMILISGIDDVVLKDKYKKYESIQIVNKLTKMTRVLAGKQNEINLFYKEIEEMKPISLKNLPFSIPLHSDSLELIKFKMNSKLKKIKIKKPNIKIYSSVLSREIKNGQNVRFIIENIMTSCVLWEDLFDYIKKTNDYKKINRIMELPPSNNLAPLLKTKDSYLSTLITSFH